MKQLVAILMLLLLVACSGPALQKLPQAPGQTTDDTTETAEEDVTPTAAETAQEQQQSGVTSTIGGSTGTEGITATGKTDNYIISVDKDGYHPAVLSMLPGNRAKITITNDDSVDHSFIVAEFNINVVIPAKGSGLVDFTPLKKGDFVFTEKDGSKAGELLIGTRT
jgi:hypothetical protein